VLLNTVASNVKHNYNLDKVHLLVEYANMIYAWIVIDEYWLSRKIIFEAKVSTWTMGWINDKSNIGKDGGLMTCDY
jgi:hypothetical protein